MRNYVRGQYHNPAVKISTELAPGLKWQPSLQFKISAHLLALVEVSETPFPQIIAMRRGDIEDMDIPISVYSACPEEAFLGDQANAKSLIGAGFGLFTVDQYGAVSLRASCIPLIQRISDQEFKLHMKDLSPTLRRRLVQAYEHYKVHPPSGVGEVAELLEGMILKAGREAVKAKILQAGDVKAGQSAATLDAMLAVKQLQNARAAIGSARGYMSEIRNTNAHFPKNARQASQKYRECRHSFLDGVKRIRAFRMAMRTCGLTGGV